MMLILQAATRLPDSTAALILHVDSAAQLLDRRYVQLLENVNAQLSHQSTAYGVVCTILAIVVAVLTIGAGAMIIFRDREYKRQLKEVVDQFKAVSSTFLADRKQEFATLEEQIRTKEAERAEATAGEARERVDAELARLRAERQRVVNETEGLHGVLSHPSVTLRSVVYKHTGDPYVDFRSCSDCGREYDRNATHVRLSNGRSGFKCPNCGKVDAVGE